MHTHIHACVYVELTLETLATPEFLAFACMHTRMHTCMHAKKNRF